MGILDNAKKTFDINLSFADFRNVDGFFDVTLAADSSNGSIEAFRAHKLILSACSPVLRSLLKEQSKLNANSHMMPVMLYLRGISTRGLKHVLDFVYNGSISLPQEELNDFLAVGESLQIPLMQRSKVLSTKRSTVPNIKKRKKRPRLDLHKALPKDYETKHKKPESVNANVPENIQSEIEIEIKSEFESAMPNEGKYEQDVNPEPEDDLYDGAVDPDSYNEKRIVKKPVTPAPEEISTGLKPPTVDELMQSKVKSTANTFVCIICGKSNTRSDSMRRHMREIHLSSDEDYHCPPCNKYFKNRQNIYNHIRKYHKDWNGVNYEYFRVNSLPRPMSL